ncbi:MAG: WYL domain-containing protein [Lachnospiraceae bacterium]|nr:WYL domain-containing protein [bacterium]MDY5517591.1 WYL domain-containing protein [Lachnospiraceae bacterium]
MPKSYGQKLKILYLAQLLLEKSDESHPLTTKEMIDYLAAQGIHAERKSIYDDMSALQQFGMDIVSIREKPGGYYLASRQFELPELKLLVDAVQASRFVTTKKSRELISKLETLTSRSEAGQLHRQVVVAERGKSSNEQIYYNVDKIYAAMAADCTIRFQYFEWSVHKEMIPRKGGAYYEVSPWLLTWEDENYYLIAYDQAAGILKYYRVDKMLHLSVCETPRQGKSTFEALDIAGFAKKTFGMFAGDETTVVLQCDASLAGVMIDRFGLDVSMRPTGTDQIRIRASVAVSRQFFGWLTGLGSGVQIVSPPEIRMQYEQYLKDILEQYSRSEEG